MRAFATYPTKKKILEKLGHYTTIKIFFDNNQLINIYLYVYLIYGKIAHETPLLSKINYTPLNSVT